MVTFTKIVAGLKQSRRQDLNLRPLDPEPVKGDALRLAPPCTQLQALQIPQNLMACAAQKAAGAKPSDAGLVATLSPRPRPRLRAVDALPEQLWNVRIVADALGMCRASVYRLCRQGVLVHVRIGDAIRFRRPDVESFMASHGR